MHRLYSAILLILFPILCSAQIAPLPSVSGVTAGGLSGKVEVSDLGALNYSIPLAVPPGIGGMEPKLSLSYSGVPGDGLLGAGWAVNGFSVVTRCPATVASDGTPDPAEKLEAVVYRGGTNSRMKDFYDLVLLSQLRDFSPQKHREVIQTVFLTSWNYSPNKPFLRCRSKG